MPTLTVAEALAEMQVLDRHIGKKQELIGAYLLREAQYRDPLREDGGTAAVLARELQSIQLLQERKVFLRRCIRTANESTAIAFGTQTRSLADWLIWRREVSTRRGQFLAVLRSRIEQGRREASRRARERSLAGQRGGNDLVVHVNEQGLANEIETLEELLGHLDGQRALRNATMTIEVPPDSTWKTGLEDRIDQLLRQAGALPAEGQGAGTVALQPPWSTSPELLQAARNPSQKILAIKLYRQLMGVGLLEAKKAVEAFVAGNR